MDILVALLLQDCIPTDIFASSSNLVACGKVGTGHRLQGFRIGSYDVLLASNAMRSAQHLANAMQNCKALLRADGLLAVTEPTAKTELFTLTIDLASGWWLHDDSADHLAGSSIISGCASNIHAHIHLFVCRGCGVKLASQLQMYLQIDF